MITNWPFLLPGVLPSVADIVCCAGLSTWENSSLSTNIAGHPKEACMIQKEMLEERREELLKEAKANTAQMSTYLELIQLDEMLSRLD